MRVCTITKISVGYVILRNRYASAACSKSRNWTLAGITGAAVTRAIFVDEYESF